MALSPKKVSDSCYEDIFTAITLDANKQNKKAMLNQIRYFKYFQVICLSKSKVSLQIPKYKYNTNKRANEAFINIEQF